MTQAIAFETETCSRCGGCGEYSFCEAYGKTCFKCRGKGRTLTKRAKIAVLWMGEQNLISASEVTVGMRIKALDLAFTVRSIEPGSESKSLRDGVMVTNPRGLVFRGQACSIDVPADYKVQLVRSQQDQIALRNAAVDYQNSLTKDGKARKRERIAA
jgi:hypothetical protein